MEHVLIQGQFRKTKIPFIFALISVLFIYSILSFYWYLYTEEGTIVDEYYSRIEKRYVYDWLPYRKKYSTFLSFFFDKFLSSPFSHGDESRSLIFSMAFFVLSLVSSRMMNRCELTVSNFRISGKANFGKPVDIPLNQINSISLGKFKRLTVGTPAGKISFWMIANRDNVHAALMDAILSIENLNSTSDSNLSPIKTSITAAPTPGTSTIPQAHTPKATVSQPSVVQQITCKPIIPQNTVVHEDTWVCRCGLAHQYYITSCSCGVSKREIQNCQ